MPAVAVAEAAVEPTGELAASDATEADAGSSVVALSAAEVAAAHGATGAAAVAYAPGAAASALALRVAASVCVDAALVGRRAVVAVRVGAPSKQLATTAVWPQQRRPGSAQRWPALYAVVA